MPRGISVKSVKTTIGNADVQEMFQSMLGEGSKDVAIVWPKFKRVRRDVERCVRTLSWLADRPWLAREFAAEQASIHQYVLRLEDEFRTYFLEVPDLDAHVDPLLMRAIGDTEEARLDLVPELTSVPAPTLDLFEAAYSVAMESDLVKTLVVLCEHLTVHKTSLEDKEALSDRFLRGAGLTFAPIPSLPAANFKAFSQHDGLSPRERESLKTFLHKLYHVSHDVYQATLLPDINVDDFVDVIMQSMDQLKKQPGLNRCDDAFRKIQASVNLLKGNFTKYSRDMKISGNPTIILESFVVDVSNDETANSPSLKRQFRQIISFYKKQAKNRPMDAKAKTIFAEIDRNFEELDRRSKDEGEGGGAAAGPGPDAASAAAAPAPAPPPEEEPLLVELGTPEERAARKARLLKDRKARATARRAAAKSIDVFVAAGIQGAGGAAAAAPPPAAPAPPAAPRGGEGEGE